MNRASSPVSQIPRFIEREFVWFIFSLLLFVGTRVRSQFSPSNNKVSQLGPRFEPCETIHQNLKTAEAEQMLEHEDPEQKRIPFRSRHHFEQCGRVPPSLGRGSYDPRDAKVDSGGAAIWGGRICSGPRPSSRSDAWPHGGRGSCPRVNGLLSARYRVLRRLGAEHASVPTDRRPGKRLTLLLCT